MELFGDLGVIHWYSSYADLTEVQTVGGAISADQGFLELLAPASQYFADGSCSDMLLMAIR